MSVPVEEGVGDVVHGMYARLPGGWAPMGGDQSLGR